MSIENSIPRDVRVEIEAEKKLKTSANYEEIEAIVPEVAAMKGFDQKTKYHGLTLDRHTKEFGRLLGEDDFVKNHPKKDLIRLASVLHDIGKAVVFQEKEDGSRSFVGHENESARIIDVVLDRDFDLADEDKQFVRALAVASMNNLLQAFGSNREPKRKQLGSYDKFLVGVDKIPGNDLHEKMPIVIAFNRADKGAHFDKDSDPNDEKIKLLKEKDLKDSATFDELEKALPVIIEAIMARRAGDQKAGVVFEDGQYKYQSK